MAPCDTPGTKIDYYGENQYLLKFDQNLNLQIKLKLDYKVN